MPALRYISYDAQGRPLYGTQEDVDRTTNVHYDPNSITDFWINNAWKPIGAGMNMPATPTRFRQTGAGGTIYGTASPYGQGGTAFRPDFSAGIERAGMTIPIPKQLSDLGYTPGTIGAGGPGEGRPGTPPPEYLRAQQRAQQQASVLRQQPSFSFSSPAISRGITNPYQMPAGVSSGWR
jgi:hypothetical protein